jgi:hypothetical protein
MKNDEGGRRARESDHLVFDVRQKKSVQSHAGFGRFGMVTARY